MARRSTAEGSKWRCWARCSSRRRAEVGGAAHPGPRGSRSRPGEAALAMAGICCGGRGWWSASCLCLRVSRRCHLGEVGGGTGWIWVVCAWNGGSHQGTLVERASVAQGGGCCSVGCASGSPSVGSRAVATAVCTARRWCSSWPCWMWEMCWWCSSSAVRVVVAERCGLAMLGIWCSVTL